MTFKIIKPLIASIALTAALTATAALSAPVQLTFHGLAGGQTATVEEAPVGGPNNSSWPQSFAAGAFKMNDRTGTVADAAERFLAWCLDIGAWLSTSSTNAKDYEIVTDPFTNTFDLTTAGAKQRIQDVFDANYASVESAISNKTSGYRDKSAGFQLALWDALYDSDFSITMSNGSTFSATSSSTSTVTFANTYLSNADGFSGPQRFRLTFLESQDKPRHQNLVIASVPIPAAGGLMLLALAGVGFASRRSKQA